MKMKKSFILFLAIVTFLLIGCSKSDNGIGDGVNPPPVLDKIHDITLYTLSGMVGQDKYSNEFDTGNSSTQGYSDDEFIAKVNKGVITSVHVGKTKVNFGEEIYNITVKSPLQTFLVPVLEFGATQDYVASKEIRKRSPATHKGLIYIGEKDYIDKVIYYFSDNDKLNKVEIRMNTDKYYESATYLGHLFQGITGFQDVDQYWLQYRRKCDHKGTVFKCKKNDHNIHSVFGFLVKYNFVCRAYKSTP